jgi:mRNA-degrading endonuclease toxin of MazEF toxin-antitoxin module
VVRLARRFVTFRRWDVLSAPFPFVEGYEVKRRPVLVVSTDDLHARHESCFAAMVTTARNMSDVRQDDVEVRDLAAAGLPQPCVVRLASLITLRPSREIRRLGSLGAQERRAIASLLKRWFAV